MKLDGMIYCFLILLMAMSCINNNVGIKSDRTSAENMAKISRIAEASAVVETQVPIKEGYVTVIKYGLDTVAVASSPMTIELPIGYKLPDVSDVDPSKSSSSASFRTKGSIENNYTVDFVLPENIGNAINRVENGWSAILFEDDLDGDMDYNDLILHVYTSYVQNNKKLSIKVQGIALGASNTLALGIYTKSAGKNYISQNVRNDLFSSSLLYDDKEIPQYINTMQTDLCHFKRNMSLILNVDDYKTEYIVWFIDVYDTNKDGSRGDFKYTIWAPSSEKLADDNERVNMFNKYGMPYAFETRTGNGTFKTYPREKKNITQVYPNFFNWIDGEIDGTFLDVVLGNMNDDNTNAIYSAYHNSLGKYVDIWTY